jgi:hypothetical protein
VKAVLVAENKPLQHFGNDANNPSGGSEWQKHRNGCKSGMCAKATIDHLVQDVYRPKPPDEKHASHSSTTSTGLPVEDQVRKEWDPR